MMNMLNKYMAAEIQKYEGLGARMGLRGTLLLFMAKKKFATPTEVKLFLCDCLTDTVVKTPNEFKMAAGDLLQELEGKGLLPYLQVSL